MTMQRRLSSFLFAVVVLWNGVSAASEGSSSKPAVSLPIGTVYGVEKVHTHEFLGIQYARAERWAPPENNAHKEFPGGSYDATEFGPCCPQLPTKSYIPNQQEDCLYLNVFTPNKATKDSNLPVLFWVHGGGMKFGCSAQSLPPLYNGSNLIAHAPEDVIVVTINYRLGTLGNAYFEGEVFEDPDWPTGGNYGILDVIAALKWLQVNIGYFGGDPTRVTAFGQSAGANLVLSLMTANGTKGLVSGIISESGTANIASGYINASVAHSQGETLISQAGCSSAGNTTDKLNCMRNVDLKTLLHLQGNAGGFVIDGLLLSEYPGYAFEKGDFLKVPIMLGNNEPDNFPACAAVPHINASQAVPFIMNYLHEWGVPKEELPRVVEKYKVRECTVGQCCHLMTRMMLDYTMICNGRRMFNDSVGADPSISNFWYRFYCSPQCPSESGNLCQHTAELEYVFGTVSNYESMHYPKCSWNTTVRYFSNAIISQWTSFAARGSTRSPWSAWTPSDSIFAAIVEPTVPNNVFFPTKFSGGEYCDMWDEIDRIASAKRFKRK